MRVCVQSRQSCLTLGDPMDSVARQAPLSMGFSRQEYWSGLPWPPPGDLPDSGIKLPSLQSPSSQADSLQLSHGEAHEDPVQQIQKGKRLRSYLWPEAL